MKVKSAQLTKFKRFTDFTLSEIPETARLVILTGPNGSGKTSLFEAFHFWAQLKRGSGSFDRNYHEKKQDDRPSIHFSDSVKIAFHDFKNKFASSEDHLKCFYIRSAYRHEADFISRSLKTNDDILTSTNKLSSLIMQESRISENYNRIVGEAVAELFNGREPEKSKLTIRDELIGEIRDAMRELFEDLILQGPGNPLNSGTFLFSKKASRDFHYKNLSGGEKAAFDLLLDFIVKKRAFNDTVFCIDEPELHLHTRLQARLLEVLFKYLPENCQLWLSTHSIGMARKAAELNRNNPGQLAFVDFHGHNFDETVNLIPKSPDRSFWRNMFHTALDDLSELVVAKHVIFCEGKKIGDATRKPSFDSSVYMKIFSAAYPDVDFIPLGGTHEVQHHRNVSNLVLKTLAPGVQTFTLFDLDDRHPDEVAALKAINGKVLLRRDLENYLWDDEILRKLAERVGRADLAEKLLSEKKIIVQTLNQKGRPNDDIKAISGELYNLCKKLLNLTQAGNNSEEFARNTLAPLVTSDTLVYKELESVIF